MENSKIEWTDHTFNPWIACQHASPGWDNCYAEAMMDTRYGKVEWGPHGARKRTSDANWRQPVKWNADARGFRKEHGHRPRVFCASLADVFDNKVPMSWREDLFELIRECRRLDCSGSDDELIVPARLASRAAEIMIQNFEARGLPNCRRPQRRKPSFGRHGTCSVLPVSGALCDRTYIETSLWGAANVGVTPRRLFWSAPVGHRGGRRGLGSRHPCRRR
jgi:hypothetical protein